MTQTALPRPPFKVSGNASIKHLNIRKEGPDDEKIIAVDVKLEIKNVDRALCAYFDDALESFLWRHETSGLIVRNNYLHPVAYVNEISGCTVHLGDGEYLGCEAKKFALQPRDGGVINLLCSVSLYPTSIEVSSLAKMVKEEAAVSIEGPLDLFSGDPVPRAAMDAASGLSDLLREDGTTATLSTSDGDVLATFGDGPDPLYQQAVDVVRAHDRAGISLVQRHLKIGYNRAARLLEEMEKKGVVSAMSSAGARTVIGVAA